MNRLDLDHQTHAPIARSTVEAMTAPLKITATERLVLAEMIRMRKLTMLREGYLSVDVISSLLREIRGKGA